MTDHPTESQLVAWLHGELDASERRTVDELLRRDADARARLAVLGATDLALREALDSDGAPRAQPGLAGRVRPLFARAARPLLVLAAALITAIVFWSVRNDHGPAIARNDLLELRVAPRDGGAVPLFTELAFQLRWHHRIPRDGTHPRGFVVEPFPFGTTLQQQADLHAKNNLETLGKFVPVVITAEIRDPAGGKSEARLVPKRPFLVDAERVLQTVTSIDFETNGVGLRPVLWGKPAPGEWLPDQMWRLQEMPRAKTPRWFPELPGEWRLELRVDTLPPPVSQSGTPLWPAFAEPLRVTAAVVMTGTASEWSEEQDGMQARMVWSVGARGTDGTPIGLQLRNAGDRVRTYNHGGTTIAKIPQPLHFNLRVDGVEWSQRERLPMIFSGDDLFEPHHPGQVRTIVALASWWYQGERTLGQQPGPHSLQLRFHFQPSVWQDGDKELWMGELLTPPVTVEIARAK